MVREGSGQHPLASADGRVQPWEGVEAAQLFRSGLGRKPTCVALA